MKKQIYFIISCATCLLVALNSLASAQFIFETLDGTYTSVVGIYYTSSLLFIFNAIMLWIAAKGKIVHNKGLVSLLSLICIFISTNIISIFLSFVNMIVVLCSRPNEKEKEELEKTNIKNIEKKEILQRNTKGYILSAILPICYFGISIGSNYLHLTRTASIILNFVVSAIFMIVTAFIFWPTYKRDFKDFKDNFPTFFRFVFNKYIIFLLIFFTLSLGLRQIFNLPNTTENQTQINNMPIWFTLPLAVLYAPMVEEGIFRGVFRRWIKNDWLFVIISAVLFGAIHIQDEPSIKLMILQGIPYAYIGYFLARSYTKTNNIAVPMSIHFIHNSFTTILMVVLKYLNVQ